MRKAVLQMMTALDGKSATAKQMMAKTNGSACGFVL